MQMYNLPISMFVKIWTSAILRLGEVKDSLIKDIEHHVKNKNTTAQ